MPQLNPMRIRVEAEDEQTFFEYEAGVYVTKDGEFHVDLDDRLCDIAEKMPKHKHGVSVNYVARHKSWKIHGKVRGHIAEFIRDCAKDYLACEKVTERVIVYGHELNVAVWVNKDGTLQPNGVGADGGGWNKGSRALSGTGHVPYYSVGFGAAVYDKTTYKRQSGNTVTWDRVHLEKDDESPISRLNSFCRLSIDPGRSGYSTMPYSPEAAEFFYSIILGLCSLAVKIEDFFASEDKLLRAIQQRPLLEFSTAK